MGTASNGDYLVDYFLPRIFKDLSFLDG